MSKYQHSLKPYWEQVRDNLREKGHKVYNENAECDVAIVLNAMMINPMALKHKIGFVYSNNDFWILSIMMPILEKYFDKLIDVQPMSPEETTEYIIGCINDLNEQGS